MLFQNSFLDPLQLIDGGQDSKELKSGEEHNGQAGSYLIKLNGLEIFSINYEGVSALTITLFEGRPRPPCLEVRNKTASQLHVIFPGKKSVVIGANDASASEPRQSGEFSINLGDNRSSEGSFSAQSNVNILVSK